MLERLKNLWDTHRKLCVTGIAAVVVAGAYVLGGFELTLDTIVNNICSFIGGC